jgi:RNA polymerase sigma-70 factor, ECF subfamily
LAQLTGERMTDEEALSRLKEEDRDALALLFERYSRLVMTIAFRVLRDRGEAEDLMQQVFINLFGKARDYDPDKGSAVAWITRLAYFQALNRRNFLSNRQFYVGTDFDSEVDSLAGEFDLEQEVGSKRNREQILRAMEDLTEKQRATLELSFFEGMTLREIGERLGDSLENIRHNYYRGLTKLRKNALVRNLRDKKR